MWKNTPYVALLLLAGLVKLLEIDPQLSHLDSVRSIPALREIGQQYAKESVKVEHLI